MKPITRHPAILALAVFVASGCTTPNENAGYGYCDDSGCYQCDLDDACSPIDNPRCDSNAQCTSGTTCTNIGCAADCATDDDCPKDEACVSGFCAPRGFSRVTPATPRATCSAETEATDCAADEFCDRGRCKARCTSDEECGPGKVCAPCGRCQPDDQPATCGSQPVFCSEDTPCGDEKTCKRGRCHFDCTASETCPLGQICQARLCVDDPAPANPECALDLDCADGRCINGTCHPGCKTRDDCGQGHVCQLGICQPDYAPAS